VPVAKLLTYLRGIEQGEAAITNAMTSRILTEFARLGPLPQNGQADPGELTARELEILRQLATDASNREIADRLVITENTVKNHVRSILAKLKLRNRREAAEFAHEHQLIQPPFRP
jgi:DNA-binding NarL/FixJ family response regulator